jgi:hypothetical protein
MENKETLEESACKALGYDYNKWILIHSKDNSTIIYNEVTNWCKGATWQAERMYSEEEVLEIIRQYALEEHLITSSKPDIWFKQYKKK